MSVSRRLAFAVLICAFLLPHALCAGDTEATSKYNARLRMLLSERQSTPPLPTEQPASSRDVLHVFVRGNGPELKREIEKRGGVVGAVLPLLVTARIPIASLEEIASLPVVKHIEASVPLELHNDSSVVHISAGRVHRGEQPLDRKYTGRGVLMGIIDSGIDFTHPEFRDPFDSTRSRILAIWSHVQQGKAPEGYDYGAEYTQAEIEDELDGSPAGKVLQDDNEVGHGTHVAGTAAGNNGVAPDAAIVVVQIDLSREDVMLTSFVDALAYIYAKADELGMPCVINASLGQRLGVPHSGDDAASQAIDHLISAKPGRVFCSSAGNDSQFQTHWGGFPVESDSLWIYAFRDSQLYFEVSDADAETIEIAVETDSLRNDGTTIQKPVGSTLWQTPAALREAGMTRVVWPCTTSGIANDTAAVITFTAAALPSGRTEVMINMRRISRKSNIYRLKVRGSGTFHSWSGRYVADPAFNGLEFNDRYQTPDNIAQVGIPGVARRSITVGSYMNRHSYQDRNGVVRPPSAAQRRPVGELSTFSSFGPTSDGRMKPDISAPGELVVSARVAARNENAQILVGDGRYVVRSGTSMSTPAVAGAVALYLERHPTASFEEVYNALMSMAVRDKFTESHGALPNDVWGYGKLNIFAAMSGPATSVALPREDEGNPVFPNPASSLAHVQISLATAQHVLLEVYDLFGRRQLTALDEELGEGEHTAAIHTAGLAAGTYVYRLQTGGTVQTGIITVVR